MVDFIWFEKNIEIIRTGISSAKMLLPTWNAIKDFFQPSICNLSPSETNYIPSSSQLPFCSFSVPNTESQLLLRPNTTFDFYKLTLFNELIFFLFVKSNLRGNA